METAVGIVRVGEYAMAYDERGSGDRSVVLVPGLLMPRRMHARLADELAAAGFRVIVVEPLGWGESDRPAGYWNYSLPSYARELVGLLDELGIEQTVVFGTSAGANIALALAAYAPERLRGMVIESAVLEQGLRACALIAVPGLALGTYGAPLVRLLGRVAVRVPRTTGSIADLMLYWIAQNPRRAVDVVQGIIFGGVLTPRPVRRGIGVPTLTIGHRFDPVHPIADDRALADEVIDGRFLQARSILELRRSPARLAPRIIEFIAECWAAPAISRVTGPDPAESIV